MTRRGPLVALLVGSVLVVAALWAVIAIQGLGPNLGLDLRGGVSITLEPSPGQEVDEAVLEQTVSVIRERIDALGVAEPEVARQGENVLVQLPGVADREQAIDIIGRTAVLRFRPVLEIISPEAEEYAEVGSDCGELRDKPPPTDEEVVLCERAEAPGTGEELPHEQWPKLRLAPVAVAGEQIEDARAALDSTGVQWQVDLTFDAEGAERFEETTGQLACFPPDDPRRRFAIALDGIVESAPRVDPSVQCNTGIPDGRAVITVGGDRDAAEELALVIRSGALPIQLDFATAQTISPTLGEDSLRAGLAAGLIGLLLVAAYMTVLYRGIGVGAVLELMMFGAVVLGAVIVLGEVMGFTLTLAGVAGIIVAVGIAADSSILYRERYRDEIRAGRTVRTAAEHAWRAAWRTNLTGNTVSFIAAVVLWLLAIGPVRGFAFTLGLATLIDTLLFATFTRGLFGLLSRNRRLGRSQFMGLRAETVAPELALQADITEAAQAGSARPSRRSQKGAKR